MAEISLDHFFYIVCHGLDDNDLLSKAIIELATTYPEHSRLRRAAKAWRPATRIHREYKRLMLAEDLQPLAISQVTPQVIVLMKTLNDWLRTHWYRKGEVVRKPNKLAQWEIKKTPTLREQRRLLAQERAMNVEKRGLGRG